MAPGANGTDAVIIGDLGSAIGYDVLSHAFRHVMDGAELIALQKNRYWMRADGSRSTWDRLWRRSSSLPAARHTWSASRPRISSTKVLASARVDAGATAMVGDDIESDIGGALGAGLAAILARTGEFREDQLRKSSVEATYVVDSSANLPPLCGC